MSPFSGGPRLKSLRPVATDLGIGLGIIVGAFVLLIYLILLMIGLAPNPLSSACISETKQRLLNLSGLDFEIVDIDCDLIAKTESMDVYVSRHARRARQKTLLFRFDPIYGVPLPSIKVDGNAVTLSVSKIGPIMVQADRWEGRTIKYEIGSILEFPEKNGSIIANMKIPNEPNRAPSQAAPARNYQTKPI